jgi:hypothetical protein
MLTIKERLDFIDSLELPEFSGIEGEERALVQEGQASAVVDVSSMITFDADVPVQHCNDVKNSCCLAQLAANKKYDRKKQVEKWYDFYTEVLENIGWMTKGFHFTKFHSGAASFTLDLAIIDVLKTFCAPSVLVLIGKAINAYKGLLQSDYKVKLFESATHDSEDGGVQVCHVKAETGNVVMTTEAAHFSSNKTMKGIFFTKFTSSDVDLYTGNVSSILNEDIYGQVREQILKKLGSHAKEYIADLDIEI